MGQERGPAYDGSVRTPWTTIVALLATGCGLADFDVEQPIPEQRVQGSGLPSPLAALFPLPLSLDLSAKIQEQTTGPIEAITLSSLTLAITATAVGAGDTDDWSFIDELHVFVKSSRSDSTLPRVEVARALGPGAVTTLAFEIVGGVNLKPYVDEGSIVESEGQGTLPADDVTYDGQGVFTVQPL